MVVFACWLYHIVLCFERKLKIETSKFFFFFIKFVKICKKIEYIKQRLCDICDYVKCIKQGNT